MVYDFTLSVALLVIGGASTQIRTLQSEKLRLEMTQGYLVSIRHNGLWEPMQLNHMINKCLCYLFC